MLVLVVSGDFVAILASWSWGGFFPNGVWSLYGPRVVVQLPFVEWNFNMENRFLVCLACCSILFSRCPLDCLGSVDYVFCFLWLIHEGWCYVRFAFPGVVQFHLKSNSIYCLLVIVLYSSQRNLVVSTFVLRCSLVWCRYFVCLIVDNVYPYATCCCVSTSVFSELLDFHEL